MKYTIKVIKCQRASSQQSQLSFVGFDTPDTLASFLFLAIKCKVSKNSAKEFHKMLKKFRENLK